MRFRGCDAAQARYEILRSCITELQARQVLEDDLKALPPFAGAMATCVLQEPRHGCGSAIVLSLDGGVTPASVTAALHTCRSCPDAQLLHSWISCAPVRVSP